MWGDRTLGWGWGGAVSTSSHAAFPRGGVKALGVAGKPVKRLDNSLAGSGCYPRGWGFSLTDHPGTLLSLLGAWERPTAAWAGRVQRGEALASEQGKPHQLGFISSCGLSLTHVRGASTKEQALRSTLDNVSPEGRGVQSV